MQLPQDKDKHRIDLNPLIPRTIPPVVSIVGYSGSGKTTLIEKLISALKQRVLRVGTIKHDVHGFEMDRPGKDSWRHKQAGASTTIITSPRQIGMVMDADHDHHPLELLPLMAGMDIVIVEGFKKANLPKIEVFRSENGKPPACRGDKNLIAVVSNTSLDWGVPRYTDDDVEILTDVIIQKFGLNDVANSLCERAVCS
jgi:molybdopterin-guanine dinucleotide biosynthesis protein B